MPPKQRITREMILESSFTMFCQEGMEVVNARSVAKALNCSTQPIFSYFAGMDDLKTALQDKARTLFEARIEVAIQSEEPIFSACKAYFQFAMEYPHLFRQMFLLKREKQEETLAAINAALREKAILPLQAKTGEDVGVIERQCLKLWAYTHGLASLQAMGLLDVPAQDVEAMLREAEQQFRMA